MTENNFKIRREDPPARVRTVGNPSKIDREVRYLKKHPNEWFKMREAAAAGAYMVYKKRGCETRTKTVENGRYDIWAMWPSNTEE
jgi:hypothetical protein